MLASWAPSLVGVRSSCLEPEVVQIAPLPAPVPLTVIGGFLGAGKSTALNHILTTSKRRVAVLVNDFGPINIDAGLIAQKEGDLISLANGCVCCSMGGGLEDALAQVLARDPLPEWIVIEASGVSDPGRIAQVGMADPMLQLEGVVVLVDAAAVREQVQQALLADTLLRQFAAADLLVLNKIDLLPEAELALVRSWFTQNVPGVPVMSTREGRVGLQWMLDAGQGNVPATAVGPARHCHHPGQDHDHTLCSGVPDHPFESRVWRPPGLLSADLLTQALKRLPRHVLRAKGWLRTDRHGLVLLQFAGRRVRYDTVSCAPENLEDAGLVVISMRGHDWHEIADCLQTARCPVEALVAHSGACESPCLVLDPSAALT